VARIAGAGRCSAPASAALEQGISIAPGPIFSAKREFGRCIRLNFGHPDPERQKAAVAALARLVLQ
jgi:DNA-binding transcriptional MocR family regulator